MITILKDIKIDKTKIFKFERDSFKINIFPELFNSRQKL